LGEHTEPEQEWPKAFYSTANLSEWMADTGLTVSTPEQNHLRIDWQSPASVEITLPDASIALRPAVASEASYAPAATIATSQRLAIDPQAGLTINEFRRRYGAPLLSFTTFASDRPDSISQEWFVGDNPRERIEVWRRGEVVESREWRPVGGYSFHAEDLPDIPGAISRWWHLHESVWPALDLFAEHVAYGRSYSPARLLSLHTALEAYTLVRHGHKSLRKLRDYPGVPNSVTGCRNDALSLLGASRDYFSHLRHTGQRYTLADVQLGILDSTRRASALMQACLLRELGFDSSQIERVLAKYYSTWPIT
jgi:hypothetical protein